MYDFNFYQARMGANTTSFQMKSSKLIIQQRCAKAAQPVGCT
jgi:hypothetical protein